MKVAGHKNDAAKPPKIKVEPRVWAAADILWAQGKRPTQRTVQAHLTATSQPAGSARDVCRALKKWWEAQEKKAKDEQVSQEGRPHLYARELAAAIPDGFVPRAELEAAEAAHTEERNRLLMELDRKRQAVVAPELEIVKARLEVAQVENANLQKQYRRLESDATLMRDQIRVLERQIK